MCGVPLLYRLETCLSYIFNLDCCSYDQQNLKFLQARIKHLCITMSSGRSSYHAGDHANFGRYLLWKGRLYLLDLIMSRPSKSCLIFSQIYVRHCWGSLTIPYSIGCLCMISQREGQFALRDVFWPLMLVAKFQVKAEQGFLLYLMLLT